MKKKSKNLLKKEFVFSDAYKQRKEKLLKEMFGSKKRRKNENCHRKKTDDIL